MTTRQWILRTLLATLAIAAVGGAIGILFGGSQLTWQVVGSAITVSMACLFFQASNGLSRLDNWHHAGLLGMAITGIEFVLVITLIWVLDARFFSSNNLEETLAYIALTLPVTSGLAMIGLYLLRKPQHRWAAMKMLGITAFSQLFFLIAAVNESLRLSISNDDLWLTGWLTLGFGLLAVLIMLGGLGKDKWYKYIGLAGVVAAWAMAMGEVWIGGGDQPEPFTFATLVGVTFAHANVIWLMSAKPGFQSITRLIVQVLAMITAILIQISVMQATNHRMDSDTMRLASACGFMMVCGTFALLVIHAANSRNNRRRTQDESLLVYKQITLTCPHCQKVQTLPVGESQCTQCSMQFQIKLFEPHCPHCDYLLVNNTSPTCPECGKPVKAQV